MTRYQLGSSAVVVIMVLTAVACSGSSNSGTATTEPSVAGSTPVTSTPEASTTTTQAATTTTVAATTTTTLSEEELAEIEFEEDVALIRAMWRDYSDSWFGGVAEGYEATARYNHPVEECSADDYAQGMQWEDGDRAEVIVDASSIERDDGWKIRGGSADGTIPEGRIYIMTADIAYSFVGQQDKLTKAEIHSAVLEGAVYFFIACS